MQRIWTTDLPRHVGGRVLLKGWLHHFRRLSNVSFLVVRDGRGLAQVVVEEPELVRLVSALAHETVLEIEGDASAAPQAPGGVEVVRPQVRVLVESTEPPVDLSRPVLRATLPTILDHAAVTLRHPLQRARFQLAHAAMLGFRSTLYGMGFTEIQTPKIVGSATEGGANVFRLDYFGRPAYLAQSPQFYKQIMTGVFERVFEVGPVFRAEPHDTPRHLNEYVSLDLEMGFVDDHRTVMAVLRDVTAGMVKAMQEHAADAVSLLKLEALEVAEEIPSVHFADAQALVSEALHQDLRGEMDLAPAHETWLGDWARREHGSDFLFVTGYPLEKRPFYTHPDPARPDHSNSFDLLFRGLELATGGQRIHRYPDLITSLRNRGLDPAQFEGYLEAFRHGMPPHGGFAIGLERWVARMTGAANIRETTLFPRDLNRLSP